ncbi:hypothetical protein [Pseudomonas sp. WHRI 8519]|uniref:hypothetical protein n=1 Tax=Pseudomonas sp. WHRI 8519 TaxID=3162567 RepID=UPI0032EF6B2B
MLRFHYMPSDFHPLLLIVGERSDVLQLQEFFDAFSVNPRDVDIKKLAFVTSATHDVTIKLVGDHKTRGLIFHRAPELYLEWEIDQETAGKFAEEIAESLESGDKSGSSFLEIGYVGEIRAKVMFGEFDDSYLLSGV